MPSSTLPSSLDTTAEPTPSIRLLHIHVYLRPGTDLSFVDPMDLEAPGVYVVGVPGELSDEDAACCALDGFHTHVPVKVLDGMEFDVWDLDAGAGLFRNDEVDYYTLTDKVRSFRRL